MLETEWGDYEIVLVNDGSKDVTIDWLKNSITELPHLKLYQQSHQGAAAALNLGVAKAQGDTIIFIDSDLVVTPTFLQSHANALLQEQKILGHDRVFSQLWCRN